MSAQKIALIVEGFGEAAAAPALLIRVLQHLNCHDVFPRQPAYNAHSGNNLTKVGGLEKFAELAYRAPDCDAVLILIDSEGDCPLELARNFARRIAATGARKPTAIVVVHRMYEVWFVASATALRGAVCGSRTLGDNLEIPADCETVRDPKAWIEKRMTPPTYKETEDQLTLTRRIDFELAQIHSRSFRRLLHGVEQLLDALREQAVVVTP